jgi:hypothetical protein
MRMIKGWLIFSGVISPCEFQPSGKGFAALLESDDGNYLTGQADDHNLCLQRPDLNKSLIVGIDWSTGKFTSTDWTKEQVRKFVTWIPPLDRLDSTNAN